MFSATFFQSGVHCTNIILNVRETLIVVSYDTPEEEGSKTVKLYQSTA